MNTHKKRELNLQNISRPEAFQTGISKLVRKTVLEQIHDVEEPVLDACCGNGIFLLEYCTGVSYYNDITGVDLDVEALETAVQLFADNNLIAPKFMRHDVYNLPFENERFSTIFCLNTLVNIHPFSNVEKILTELYRIAKNGAKIFIDFRNQLNPVLNYRYKKNIKTGELTTYAHCKADFLPLLKQMNIHDFKFIPVGNPVPFLAKGYLLIIRK